MVQLLVRRSDSSHPQKHSLRKPFYGLHVTDDDSCHHMTALRHRLNRRAACWAFIPTIFVTCNAAALYAPGTHEPGCLLRSGGKAVGVRVKPNTPRAEGVPQEIRGHRGVVSNASVWDTQRLLPGQPSQADWRAEAVATPMTNSFMHLHLGAMPETVHCHELLLCKTAADPPLSTC